ncbi:hypothetical protein BH23ACT5_BH23ACT5_19370 [soil metagenome]
MGSGRTCYTTAQRLLQRLPDTTAIVAANDLLALGCYRAIRDLGLEVGADVSVTGYNDIPLLDLMQPAMTAVRVPYRELGVKAAGLLLRLMSADAPVSHSPVRLAPDLVVRASTAPPPPTSRALISLSGDAVTGATTSNRLGDGVEFEAGKPLNRRTRLLWRPSRRRPCGSNRSRPSWPRRPSHHQLGFEESIRDDLAAIEKVELHLLTVPAELGQ